MADDANAQETTTEDVNTETDVTESVEQDQETGADVQGTESEDSADETNADEADKAVGKQYGEAYVKKLRAENANLRVKGREEAERVAQEAAAAAEKALTEKWAKALGFAEDETEPDPAELLKRAEEQARDAAKERDTYAEKLRNYARKDAITDAANTDGVDGDLAAILDSRKIEKEVEKLDTEADDFLAQVAVIVKEAVESNPKLKKASVQAAAPRSGGDTTGGNATTRKRLDSVDDFRREIQERGQKK